MVGLGANLLYGTGIPAAILFIDRDKPNPRKGKVLIVNGDKNLVENKNQNRLSDENVAKLAEAVHRYEDEELLCKVVGLEEQIRIEAVFRSVDEESAVTGQQLAAFEMVKAGLLQDLLTGKGRRCSAPTSTATSSKPRRIQAAEH